MKPNHAFAIRLFLSRSPARCKKLMNLNLLNSIMQLLKKWTILRCLKLKQFSRMKNSIVLQLDPLKFLTSVEWKLITSLMVYNNDFLFHMNLIYNNFCFWVSRFNPFIE